MSSLPLAPPGKPLNEAHNQAKRKKRSYKRTECNSEVQNFLIKKDCHPVECHRGKKVWRNIQMVFSCCLLWSSCCKSSLLCTLLMNLHHFYPGEVLLQCKNLLIFICNRVFFFLTIIRIHICVENRERFKTNFRRLCKVSPQSISVYFIAGFSFFFKIHNCNPGISYSLFLLPS